MIKLGTAILIFFLLLLFFFLLTFITTKTGVALWGMIMMIAVFFLGVSVGKEDD